MERQNFLVIGLLKIIEIAMEYSLAMEFYLIMREVRGRHLLQENNFV